jgi:transposase
VPGIAALDWSGERAAANGWSGVTVACEPTGHRWRVLGQLAAQRSMPFVCVRPMLTSWARRSEDLTFDKTDEKDAVLNARQTAQCAATSRSRSMRPAAGWGISGRAASSWSWRWSVRCSRCVRCRSVSGRPLETAQQPFKSQTWAAAMTVVVDRDGGELDSTRRLGPDRFEQAVRRQILKQGRQKPCLRIVRKLFAALTDQTGVLAHRLGAPLRQPAHRRRLGRQDCPGPAPACERQTSTGTCGQTRTRPPERRFRPQSRAGGNLPRNPLRNRS